MSNIHPKEVYFYKGKQFDCIDFVAKQIEADIGKIIDTLALTFSPGQRLEIFNMLVSNRKEFKELLSVEIEKSNGLYDASQSIFDYIK